MAEGETLLRSLRARERKYGYSSEAVHDMYHAGREALGLSRAEQAEWASLYADWVRQVKGAPRERARRTASAASR
jgi:hypothetical protein